jgi:putative phosphoribosyl transferase
MTSTNLKEMRTYERPVSIALAKATLEGDLAIPGRPTGIVLFAHGSGSSRHSPRNRFVAETLRQHGIATLLMDLLTSKEEEVDQRTGQLRFNIRLLAKRLAGATAWVLRQPELNGMSIGYFGASTGAAAALVAAAQMPDKVAAVVSRGGRPDLAGDALGSVVAPTLLLVGGEDDAVIPLNEDALQQLGCSDKNMLIIPGATHLFEEPGTLEEAARLAADWFCSHFALKNEAQNGRAAWAR